MTGKLLAAGWAVLAAGFVTLLAGAAPGTVAEINEVGLAFLVTALILGWSR